MTQPAFPAAGPALFVFRSLSIPVLVLVVAGCDRGPSRPAPTETPAKRPEPVVQETPSGGTFRMSLSGIARLEPAVSTSLSENFVLHQIFQGLVRFDPRLRVIPDLADSWSLSLDRKEYTFVLDPVARFHDGTPVEAEDVVFSLRRLLDPRVGSPARSYFEGALDGGAEGIMHVEPGRVVLRLREPDHIFISFLAMQYAKVLPRHLADDPGFRDHPVGSGPFRYAGRDGEEIVLEAFRPGGEGRPYLDRVVFADLDRRREGEALEADSIDYLVVAADELLDLPNMDRFRTIRVNTLSLHFLGLNVTRPPFDDLRVRRAVALALNRDAFEGATRGRVKAARAVLPPGIPGYDPQYDPFPHDPEAARALLAEAGYGPDRPFPEVALLLGRIPEQMALSDRVQQDLAAVGIPVRMETTDDYNAFMRDLPESDLAVMGWGVDYPDPDNLFFNLFRSGARYNFFGYSNPELDAMIDEGRAGAMVDRARLYRRAERVLLEDVPVVPLFHDAAVHCVRRGIEGLVVNAMGIYYGRLDGVFLDGPGRADGSVPTSIRRGR